MPETDVPVINGPVTTTVAGVDLLVHTVRETTSGREKQYLERERPDGSSAATAESDKPPARTFVIESTCERDQVEALRDKRSIQDDTFTIDILDLSVDTLELAGLSIERSGDEPWSYQVEITVRQYRPVTTTSTEPGPVRPQNDGGQYPGSPSGATPPVPAGQGTGDIGGGQSYTGGVAPGDATVQVNSGDGQELARTIANAASGETVYVTNGPYTIDRVQMEADNVTLAGSGALIEAGGVEGRPIQINASGVRITSLRFAGPDETWNGEAGSNDHHPVGIEVQSGGQCEFDNLEGFGWEAVFIASRGSAADIVHHCNIHDNPGASMGYGVACGQSGGLTVIEKCYFNRNRHSIEASPDAAGYEARDNIIGPIAYNHSVDQHGPDPAGGTILVHHNTFQATESDANSVQDAEIDAVRIRGKPREIAEVHHNLLYAQDIGDSIAQTGEPKVDNADKYNGSATNKGALQNMRIYENVAGQQSAPNAGARAGGSVT